MNKFLCLILLLLLISCSSEKPAEVSSQKPSEVGGGRGSELSRPPASSVSALYSLEIVPTNATRNSTIYLVAQGFKPSDAKIEWLVNGNQSISLIPNQFKATETKKGDEVQARAIIQDREVTSNIIIIKNAPPEIDKVKILPEVFKPGDALYVDVSGSDIDGDEVTITYEWAKNGESAGNDKKIETSLKRGDKFSVKITPFDGESYGRPIVLHREIRNMHPTIIEDKKFVFDGKVWSYQVKATDPDGDPLTYSLKTALSGMTIEPSTGFIKWNVPPEFKGKAPVTVSVKDGHGGEAVQSFTLEITPEKR